MRPKKEDERGFCSDNCRKSYHKHGGAYRKLKVEMQRMVTKHMAAINDANQTELRILVARRMDEIEKQVRALVLEELTKYAKYAKVVQDFSPTLRVPQ